MKGKPKVKSERKEAFFRILVLIVSGIILKLWGVLACFLAFVNWLIALFSGKRSRGIAEFVEYWNTEMYKFMRYLAGVNNIRPFPFSDMERISKFEKN